MWWGEAHGALAVLVLLIAVSSRQIVPLIAAVMLMAWWGVATVFHAFGGDQFVWTTLFGAIFCAGAGIYAIREESAYLGAITAGFMVFALMGLLMSDRDVLMWVRAGIFDLMCVSVTVVAWWKHKHLT